MGLKNGITLSVGGSQLLMNLTIHIYDDGGGVTVEIHDEAGNHLLPPKV